MLQFLVWSCRQSESTRGRGIRIFHSADWFYLQVLNGQALFDVEANSRALLSAQSPIGGFGKAAGEFPGER